MKEFEVESRTTLVIQVVACLAFPLFFSLLIMQDGRLGIIPVILLIVSSFGIFNACRKVRTIRVMSDGAMEFDHIIGTTAVQPQDVHHIKGVRKSDGYGGDTWTMKVEHRAGTVTIDFFGSTSEFLATVRERNPRVHLSGEWPVIFPWEPDYPGAA